MFFNIFQICALAVVSIFILVTALSASSVVSTLIGIMLFVICWLVNLIHLYIICEFKR